MPFDVLGPANISPVVLTPGSPALSPAYTSRAVAGGSGALNILGGGVGTGVCTVTFTGTMATGKTGTITIGIPNTNSTEPETLVFVPFTYVATGGDNLTTFATALLNLVNADTSVGPLITATSGVGTVILTAANVGVTYPVSSTATGLTVAQSYADVDLTATITPTKTFANAQPNSDGPHTFYQNMPVDCDAATKADLHAQGLV